METGNVPGLSESAVADRACVSHRDEAELQAAGSDASAKRQRALQEALPLSRPCAPARAHCRGTAAHPRRMRSRCCSARPWGGARAREIKPLSVEEPPRASADRLPRSSWVSRAASPRVQLPEGRGASRIHGGAHPTADEFEYSAATGRSRLLREARRAATLRVGVGVIKPRKRQRTFIHASHIVEPASVAPCASEVSRRLRSTNTRPIRKHSFGSGL